MVGLSGGLFMKNWIEGDLRCSQQHRGKGFSSQLCTKERSPREGSPQEMRRNMLGFTFHFTPNSRYISLPETPAYIMSERRWLHLRTSSVKVYFISSFKITSFHLAFWVSAHGSLLILQWPLHTPIRSISHREA